MLLSWIVLSFLLGGLEAAMKTYSVETLCSAQHFAYINANINSQESGILYSVPRGSVVDCQIMLRPGLFHSMVLSIQSYNLNSDDELIIIDSDGMKMQLLDTGFFSDERKSILSDGMITIHYKTNGSFSYQQDLVKFLFVYTQTRKAPCVDNEFECRNGRCIKRHLVCDTHNHCGDRSDQKKCAPIPDTENSNNAEFVIDTRLKITPIIIIAVSSILVIIIIALVAVLIRRSVQKKKEAKNSLPTEVAATAPPDPQPHPSYFTQIRRSIRARMGPKVEQTQVQNQGSENYQVPAMYPQVPTNPEFDGIENPDFKVEE